MVGPVPAREDEAARLTGARGDFVASLGRRVEALRVSLRAVEQSPNDGALRNGLLRRVHALSSAARVLGFASVAEALTETEKRLRKSEFGEVARSLDMLPSLLQGMPVSLRPAAVANAARTAPTWPLSVLIFGAQGLAEAIQAIPGTHVECERTEDLARGREQARLFGPDLAVIDVDRSGARELIDTFVNDPQVEPVPLIVIGDFAAPEAAAEFLRLGAARVLSKPVSPETLQRIVVELRALAAEPRAGRDPLGELSVEALTDRIVLELRRGLLDAVEPGARGIGVGFGEGADVMAAVWGAVARVRELVTLRSSGAVRFDTSGPEGAVPMAAWGSDEPRAGNRGATSSESRAGDNVSLQGRRIVVADDDPAVVWFMSGLLRALGVEVLEAHDGSRALALTYDAWPDLVVSDVLMPRLDGFTLCHEIKRDVAVRDVPVILLSWKEDLLQRVRELGANADGYLRKEAAASTVAERLREVLRPRARVEQRIATGGDARGRLDGLTPRLILELASAGARDVRVGIRDAVYLYEVQIRRGRLCSATRSSADGSFERGEFVLAALLGVSAGRFIVEPDATPCRADFDGTAAQILKAPIERSRAALSAISAAALVGVTRVHIAAPAIEGYLGCTPEPARQLLGRIMAGASPRELITSGSVAPHLLEAVLSDIARRGAITSIERLGTEPPPMRGSVPPSPPSPPVASPSLAAPKVMPTPSQAPKAEAPDVSAEDAGWFSFQLESGTPALPEPAAVDVGLRAAETWSAPATPSTPEPAAAAPVVSPPLTASAPEPAPVPAVVSARAASAPAPADSAAVLPPAAALQPASVAPARVYVAPVRASVAPVGGKPQGLPFNSDVTPSVNRQWDKITEGVFSDPGTLQGVGVPEVARLPSVLPMPTDASSVSPPPAVGHAAPARPVLAPADLPAPPEELDALASALTEQTPSPVASAASGGDLAPVEPRAADLTEEGSAPPPSTQAPPTSRPTLASQRESKAPSPGSSRVSALKTLTPPARVPAAPNSSSGWLVRFVVVAGAAFAVAYFVVSYYRMQGISDAGPPPAPPPATP